MLVLSGLYNKHWKKKMKTLYTLCSVCWIIQLKIQHVQVSAWSRKLETYYWSTVSTYHDWSEGHNTHTTISTCNTEAKLFHEI